jgi:hypothetical protein
MPTRHETLPHSTYRDYAGYRSDADLPADGAPVAHFTLNVALVLQRAQDPTPLLSSAWGTRQQALQALERSGQLWTTYGADPAAYDRLKAEVAALGLRTVDQVDPANGYVASAAARTLWVQVDETSFATLFGPGARLMEGTTGGQTATRYWEGSLHLPEGWASDIGVRGIVFDDGGFRSLTRDTGSGPAAPLAHGPQGKGNAARDEARAVLAPDDIAAAHYGFPLGVGSVLATGAIALLEPGIGDAVPTGQSFQAGLDAYRAALGLPGPGRATTIAPGGQRYDKDSGGERSLDVGVVTGAAPGSEILLYAGSGHRAGARSDAFTAYQAAIWDEARNPGVLSSSFTFAGHMTPGSPFYFAADELFTDAALRNVAVFQAAGDGGSGDRLGNGLTNVRGNQASPYAVLVGGTSLSTQAAAAADPTLADLVARAEAWDPATLWSLVAGGLKTLPGTDAGARFVETVWNAYRLAEREGGLLLHPGYTENKAGAGGVDPSRPLPAFQQGFGPTPVTADPLREPGRALPDLALLAGGNMFYRVPAEDMQGLKGDGGTSAAAPLMAAFAAQMEAIFADQGLPRLGYHTDLYYAASLLVPGAFHDVSLGHNTSSFQWRGPGGGPGGGEVEVHGGQRITPTGYGHEAGEGFDLASGLGTPNGVLLARALTALGHGMTTYAGSPAVVDPDGAGGWASGAAQTLLVAASTASSAALAAGYARLDVAAEPAGAFAWNSRVATQFLQPDVAPELVRLFDGAAQGALRELDLAEGEALAVAIGGAPATAPQGATTAGFGFVDFGTAAGAVRLARPVAEARTVGGADDQVAILRLRQNGGLESELLVYRVDDLAGRIDGIAPGEPGYAEASLARAYATEAGGPWVSGPGHGLYGEARLSGVDSGDLVAMRLRNPSGEFWAFAEANERDADGRPVPHLWPYALDTWGWEDMQGGGDRDFNDLVVQIDFTSASGSGVLA